MHITRRKFPNYPVALAIALCFANIAHAQLCLTAADRTYLPVFTGRTDCTLTLESKSAPVQISLLNTGAVQPTSFVLARTQDVVSPETISSDLLPTTISVQKEPATVFRLNDEFLQKLMIAAAQPMRAATDLQSVFAE